MNELKPIRNEAEYQATLARIDEIFNAKPGTPEGKELTLLIDLVVEYEKEEWPI
jgi:HTH-type transcriptional regulator / antitoxin HigA